VRVTSCTYYGGGFYSDAHGLAKALLGPSNSTGADIGGFFDPSVFGDGHPTHGTRAQVLARAMGFAVATQPLPATSAKRSFLKKAEVNELGMLAAALGKPLPPTQHICQVRWQAEWCLSGQQLGGWFRREGNINNMRQYCNVVY
jgi:hypothetical protein